MAYLFAELETAHRMATYCGIVKLHKVNADITWSVIGPWEMRRADLKEKFKTVFGNPIPKKAISALEAAEKVRDKVAHGTAASNEEHRKGQVNLFDYAEELHSFLPSIGSVSPFSDMRGFKGAGQPLSKETSRWVLKGMGFPLQ